MIKPITTGVRVIVEKYSHGLLSTQMIDITCEYPEAVGDRVLKSAHDIKQEVTSETASQEISRT